MISLASFHGFTLNRLVENIPTETFKRNARIRLFDSVFRKSCGKCMYIHAFLSVYESSNCFAAVRCVEVPTRLFAHVTGIWHGSPLTDHCYSYFALADVSRWTNKHSRNDVVMTAAKTLTWVSMYYLSH